MVVAPRTLKAFCAHVRLVTEDYWCGAFGRKGQIAASHLVRRCADRNHETKHKTDRHSLFHILPSLFKTSFWDDQHFSIIAEIKCCGIRFPTVPFKNPDILLKVRIFSPRCRPRVVTRRWPSLYPEAG